MVVSAAVPFYPDHGQGPWEGTAVLTVWTDGYRVARTDRQSGPPILLRHAEENLKTWQFHPHAPTTFRVSYTYILESPALETEVFDDTLDNGTVVLKLPESVELRIRRKHFYQR